MQDIKFESETTREAKNGKTIDSLIERIYLFGSK